MPLDEAVAIFGKPGYLDINPNLTVAEWEGGGQKLRMLFTEEGALGKQYWGVGVEIADLTIFLPPKPPGILEKIKKWILG